jgi:hypothetical protein
VTILGDLEGRHIHGIELYVVSALVVYHLVGEYTPAIGDQVAHAFPVEGNPLRGSSVKLVDGHYSSLVYAGGGVRVPIVPRKVLGDRLRRRLLVHEETLGQPPLNFKGLSSLIEGYHGMSPLGWNAAFVENHIDAIFTPLGVMEWLTVYPLRVLVEKYAAARLATRCFFFGGVSMSITSSPVSSVTYKKYLVTSQE